MRSFIYFMIPFVIIFLLFKLFGFILFRFWFIIIPLIVYYYVTSKLKKKKDNFKNRTHLDPKKEVKLDQDFEVIDDE